MSSTASVLVTVAGLCFALVAPAPSEPATDHVATIQELRSHFKDIDVDVSDADLILLTEGARYGLSEKDFEDDGDVVVVGRSLEDVKMDDAATRKEAFKDAVSMYEAEKKHLAAELPALPTLSILEQADVYDMPLNGATSSDRS